MQRKELQLIQSFYLKNKIKKISTLDFIKILILIVVSFSLIANFYPYYEGWDSFVYGISAINLSQGSFEITNELLQTTGSVEFAPTHWIKTIHNTAIPIASPGILGLASFSYLLGGYYGLFYVAPVFSIFFLIVSERIATKLFGGYVGLFTLVLLSTDFIILSTGTQLLTDNIFSLFFILGCFFLIKFFQDGKNKFVFLSSIFFVTAAFFRFNGIIFFPIEILVVVGFFAVKLITDSKNSKNQESKISLLKNKNNLLKTIISIIIPWSIFFIFWFTFNDYYFGDPLMTYYSNLPEKSDISTIFLIDSNRFESIKFYSSELIPDPIKLFFNFIYPTENDADNNDFLTSFAIIILSLAVFTCLVTRNKRIEVFVFLIFLLGSLMFFSSEYATSIGNSERFMIPNLAISFMFLGFIISMISKKCIQQKLKNHPNRVNLFMKSILVIVLLVIPPFVLLESVKMTSEDVLLYETKGIQRAKSGFNYNNPKDFVERFPLDLEGLTKNSVIVASEGRRIVEYNAIPLSIYAGGIFPINGIFNSEVVPQKPIESLKKLINEGYDVYSFKDHWWEIDPQYFRHIEKNHGLILKDYSNTFCKMKLAVDEKNNSVLQSDNVCYMYRESVIPKI